MTDELIERMVEAGAGTMPASLHHLDVKALARGCLAAALRAWEPEALDLLAWNARAEIRGQMLQLFHNLADRLEKPDAAP